MKAVFIRPINPSGSGYLKYYGFLPTPLGLLQLAGDVRAVSESAQIKIIDMEADEKTIDDVIKETVSFQPNIVGITLHATAAHNVSTTIVKAVKEQVKDVITIAGGHHATFVPYQMIREGFDVVVIGEGDETMIELTKAIENHEDFRQIKGIVYRNKDGEIVRTPPRPLIEDLNKLPMPELDLVEREKYPIKIFGDNQYATCIETSRGCPYACDFCSVTPTWGNKWRNKSNKRIIEELRLAKKLGYEWVFFVDDIFIVWPNRKQREELFKLMIDEDFNIRFITQMRADVTARNLELIKLAAEAGLRVSFLGAESGSQEILKKMHKGLSVSDTVKAVKVLHDNGVLVLVGLILGAPYESLKDMITTIKFAWKLGDYGADAVQFSIYTPLPGTRIFDKALREKSLFTLNWDRFDIITPVMKTKVNPLIIQILSAYGTYFFYIRKYLKSKFRIIKLKYNGEKLELLRRAERFLWKRMPYYLKDAFISLPKALIETYKLYKAGMKLSEELINELLQTSNMIVYQDIGDKNRYFKIKTD